MLRKSLVTHGVLASSAFAASLLFSQLHFIEPDQFLVTALIAFASLELMWFLSPREQVANR